MVWRAAMGRLCDRNPSDDGRQRGRTRLAAFSARSLRFAQAVGPVASKSGIVRAVPTVAESYGCAASGRLLLPHHNRRMKITAAENLIRMNERLTEAAGAGEPPVVGTRLPNLLAVLRRRDRT